ncbi:MAG: hypothetical protein ABIR55_03855, partial [Burkholderiaceae bacterium]
PERESPGSLAGDSEANTNTQSKGKTNLPLVVRWRNAVCAEGSALTSTQRLVALVMSLYGNQNGTRCHPSEVAIAAATALSVRAVRTALGAIERTGFASRQMIKGQGQAWRWTLWTLLIPEGAEAGSLPRRKGAEVGSSPSDEGAATDDSDVRQLTTEGEEPVAADVERAPRKSDVDLKAMPQTNKSSSAERFADFWASYPRKQGDKPKAARIWAKKGLDAIADKIIAHITERIASDSQWSDRTFIPLPTTFLTGERWNDEWVTKYRKPRANDCFDGKKYVGTPDDQLPAWAKAALDANPWVETSKP